MELTKLKKISLIGEVVGLELTWVDRGSRG